MKIFSNNCELSHSTTSLYCEYLNILYEISRYLSAKHYDSAKELYFAIFAFKGTNESLATSRALVLSSARRSFIPSFYCSFTKQHHNHFSAAPLPQQQQPPKDVSLHFRHISGAFIRCPRALNPTLGVFTAPAKILPFIIYCLSSSPPFDKFAICSQ